MTFGTGAEIIAIENTDYVGCGEDWTTWGQVDFDSAQTFVDNVLAALGARQMSMLHIQVHGNFLDVSFGSDRVSTSTFGNYSALFGRLTPKFDPNSWVFLRACDVGQNIALLQQFQQLWNVGIVAGRWRQNNVLDFNLGYYQIIDPAGNQSQSFTLPWAHYSFDRRLLRAVTSRL